MEIKDQHILITGANRGIGRAVAHMCAGEGAHLILANRTSDPAVLDEFRQAGAASVKEIPVDLGTSEGIESFLRDNGHLRVDILFNNAGQLTGGLLEEQDPREIRAMLHVNLLSLIRLTQTFLPGMIERKCGKIINHSSVSADMHFPAASTYSASKAAVSAFTECLRTELGGTGVTTLLLITPGIETRMFKEIPRLYGKYLDLTLLKSLPAKKYAQMIREAILEDLEVLKPPGVTGIGHQAARHFPRVFGRIVASRFRRPTSG